MNINDLEDLKKEFEAMAGPCSLTPQQQQDAGDGEDDEDIPHYVEELQKKLLAPAISGVYLTRVDLKRIADDLDESLPIKERKPMLRALMRHTTSKDSLREIFEVTNRYIDGRSLIYSELAEAFPASAGFFNDNQEKIAKTKKMFDRIVEDFEEIEMTDEAMLI
jgi:hypothetical protein